MLMTRIRPKLRARPSAASTNSEATLKPLKIWPAISGNSPIRVRSFVLAPRDRGNARRRGSMQLADLAREGDRIIRIGCDRALRLPFDGELSLGIELADQRRLIEALVGGEFHHPHG